MNKENFLIKSLLTYYADLIKYVETQLINLSLSKGLTSTKKHLQVIINEYRILNPNDKNVYNIKDTAKILTYHFNKKILLLTFMI